MNIPLKLDNVPTKAGWYAVGYTEDCIMGVFKIESHDAGLWLAKMNSYQRLEHFVDHAMLWSDPLIFTTEGGES